MPALLEPLAASRLISAEQFDPRDGDWTDVTWVAPGGFLSRLLPGPVRDVLRAWRTLRRAGPRTAILCNGSARVATLTCFLNEVLPTRRRTIVLWDSFVVGRTAAARFLIRRMLRGATAVVVYSQTIADRQADLTGVPADKFVVLPYKANHSQRPPLRVPIGNYVFSGGNSQRDYRTLFDAVRGTDVPVIVSATDPAATAGLDVPPNVILVAAREPHFARLMAGSRFVVVPTFGGLTHGAAEATVCNAMWHGKPVIATNDTSLADHVGDAGYVLESGDVVGLRNKILRLWNSPDWVAELGRRAHERVAADLTHEHFVRRLNRLATELAASA
ncbi:MAG TPA: glycosyltransferase [Gemmataceae bacterium]|jgi:glycosyltransferase involved in cell wall biosynthesis|nr:glycosyltransferase [Gemmataceae bacterium]